MSDDKEKTITLDADGNVEIELDGFVGTKCFEDEAQTEKKMEEQLGVKFKIEEVETKPEGECAEPDWERNPPGKKEKEKTHE